MSISNNTISGNDIPSLSDNEIEKPIIPPLQPTDTENTNILNQLNETLKELYSDCVKIYEFIVMDHELEEQRIIKEQASASENIVLETEYREKVIETLTELKENLAISVSANSVSSNTISSNNVVEAEFIERLNTYMETNMEASIKLSENMEKSVSANYIMIGGIGLVIGIIVAGFFMRWFK